MLDVRLHSEELHALRLRRQFFWHPAHMPNLKNCCGRRLRLRGGHGNGDFPGYLDKEKRYHLGLQTDEPLKRACNPFGGMRMVRSACKVLHRVPIKCGDRLHTTACFPPTPRVGARHCGADHRPAGRLYRPRPDHRRLPQVALTAREQKKAIKSPGRLRDELPLHPGRRKSSTTRSRPWRT